MHWKKAIKLTLVLFVLAQASSAMIISVDVDRIIDGSLAHLKYDETVDGGPQHIMLNWENVGSVACRIRMRVDVHNETGFVQTAWSGESPIEVGDNINLDAFYNPSKTGEYAANISLIYCNRIFAVKTINFTVNKVIKPSPTLFEISIDNTMDSVEFKIKTREDVRELIITPRDYPLEWIFESGLARNLEGGKGVSIQIPYTATRWLNKTIVFDVIAPNEGFAETVSHTLKEKKYSTEEKTIMVLAFVNAIQLLALAALYRGYRNTIKVVSDSDPSPKKQRKKKKSQKK